MDPLHRERYAHKIVHILAEVYVRAEVDLVIAQLEARLDREGQILEAAVANHDHSALYRALHFGRILEVSQIHNYLQVSIKHLGILKCPKELTPDVPLVAAPTGLQSSYGYYKGLQR